MIGTNVRRVSGIIVMIAAISIFSAGAFAQGQGQGQGRGQGRGQGQGRMMMGPQLIERFHNAVNELGLSDEQKPKVDEIFAKAKDDFAKLQPELQDLPMQERGQRVREFTQKLVSDVKGVLNDQQKADFDKRVAELQAQRGGGQGAGQGGQMRRMRDAVASLQLTDEQKPKVEEILTKAEKDAEQARQESQGDPEAMREKARAIAQNTITALEQVLTPEQQQQFRESMRAARGGGAGDGQGVRERRRDGTGPATRPSDAANPPATQPEKKTSDR
jgi:Spy/CpxP family protein refolding chaperone